MPAAYAATRYERLDYLEVLSRDLVKQYNLDIARELEVRNDLARVARVGSVRVPRLCEVETFATVHHLVSSVTAELAPGRTVAVALPQAHIRVFARDRA